MSNFAPKANFDAVLDLEAVVSDPEHPSQLLDEYATNDHLHLRPKGYEAVADEIDVGLFVSAE